MTRDDIIRMARGAGLEDDDSFVLEPHTIWYFDELQLERFAALVAAANKPETAIAEAYRCGWEAGAIATRDACIALCEEHWRNGGTAMECADAIRARGKK